MLSWFSLSWAYDAPRGCPIPEQRQDGHRVNAAPDIPGSHHLAHRLVGWAGPATPGLPLLSTQRKQDCGTWGQTDRVWTPALRRNSCAALGKLANPTMPPFLLLENGDNDNNGGFIEFPVKIKRCNTPKVE